ncbi:3-hydroxyacyl-CoA dehydrogenase NAD-binding domain-containing protein [Phreatobacter cathodiphilus]|uniref:3-hydroxyacyl-CoA dehydrogenase NAD-binding domain-containing protein n=1 Tax=Phreatobacter cathodiphilus TaxID=1868589 RepID=UPI001C06747F|nr:3-hydroxyacyl-CoA dehydrogenase NAD-binding domain-containing protein [Phreatobacter cathodiphilus]
MNEVVDLATEGRVAVVTVNSPPVNALSANVRTGIAEAVQKAGADPAVTAVVIHCAGRTFIAGADITEFGKPPKGVPLNEVNAILEACPKPVVAAIHGTALGGGLELALSCHYRVAVPSAKLGLPEVKLGLVPGAGGTQRLPRLVGVERALEVIAFGEPMKAAEAASHGLVDAVVGEGSLKADAVAFAEKLIADAAPLKKVRDRADKLGADPAVFAAFRKANARRFRGFEAPEACIQCVEAAVSMPFDEGLKFERDTIMRLMVGTQSLAQRYVFFAERQAAKIPDVPEGTPTRTIAKVGIIGAGTMGGGIAMNFVNVGIPVTIVETKQEALDRGLSVIRKNYENTAKRGRLSMADVETRMGRFTPTLDLSALADCDLVVEAVFENMEIKKEVFGKLDAIAKPGAILATNTSYLDVDQIAAMTKRPEDVIGMHFFSPANVMRLLEVVRGEKTAKDVIATAMGLAKTIGKVGVLVGVCHGFVGNRMLAQRQREANKLILEGAMPWDVDRVLYDFGLPMGPFAMSDLAGLDIGWSRETSKGETPREILCEMDRRGQKTGAGFYDYDENRVAKPSPVTEKIILDLAAKKGINRRQISDEEILQRCIYPMINEGAKILEEGKAIRASDIDIVWINGYGWPVYRGGPMFYGDTVGLPEVLKVMKEFEGRHGADFKPSALLEKLAAEGKGFKDLK